MSRDTMAVDTEQSLSRRKPPVCQIVPPRPGPKMGKRRGGYWTNRKVLPGKRRGACAKFVF